MDYYTALVLLYWSGVVLVFVVAALLVIGPQEVLVCQLRKAGPPKVADSTPGRCAECDSAVWVAPSGHALIQRLELTILSAPCLERHSAEGEMIIQMPLQPEQIEERRRRGVL